MYKNYTINQVVLPMDFRMKIADDDISVLIHHFVESIPEQSFKNYYQQLGRPQYHPRMMLSILLCAYAQGIYSGRKIEELLHDSIRMIWLAQGETPNFRTINRFRVNPHMGTLLQSAFLQFRNSLLNSGLIDGKAMFIDGTKIEADANKFTFVWKKSIQKYEDTLDKNALSAYHELVEKEILPEIIKEMKEELTQEELEAICEQLLERKTDLENQISETELVEERKVLRKEKSEVNKANKKFQDFSERKTKYQSSKEILGERNSCSKTDTDATFMRMKDDPMKNGQLKPGYNIQLATQNQYALAYDVFPNPTDTRTLIPFLNTIKESFELPKFIVADAGYGSEENYQHIVDIEERTPLISYNMYIKEQKRKYKNNLFQRENWKYVEEDDFFVCPNNKKIIFSHYSKRTDKYGFTRDFKMYECEDCSGCPLKNQCTKAKGNRKIQLNANWEYFKAQVKKLLQDEEIGEIYRQRKIDVEPTFGEIKKNLGFTRFHVRGTRKVKIETGLVFLAHNFRKLIARIKKYEGKALPPYQLQG